MQLKPLNPGENGPPYLVNGFVVTRAYIPGRGRYWKVYTRALWELDGRRCAYETKWKTDAIAYARHKEPLL